MKLPERYERAGSRSLPTYQRGWAETSKRGWAETSDERPVCPPPHMSRWLTNQIRPGPASCYFLGRVDLMRFRNPTLNNQRQLIVVRKVTV